MDCPAACAVRPKMVMHRRSFGHSALRQNRNGRLHYRFFEACDLQRADAEPAILRRVPYQD
jgi:hypothetical protein